jgi:hypothetical protein
MDRFGRALSIATLVTALGIPSSIAPDSPFDSPSKRSARYEGDAMQDVAYVSLFPAVSLPSPAPVVPAPSFDELVRKEWSALRARGLRLDTRYFNRKAQEPRSRPIDMVVLHTTESGVMTVDNLLSFLGAAELCHYCITRDGAIAPIVYSGMLATHAGESVWSGVSEVDHNSIGIEIQAQVMPRKQKDSNGRYVLPITDPQYAALKMLVAYLEERYGIPLQRFLGHDQVAYSSLTNSRGRKYDPGLDFSWEKAGLPDNYVIPDPDVLSGRVGVSPYSVRKRQVTEGQHEASILYKVLRSATKSVR